VGEGLAARAMVRGILFDLVQTLGDAAEGFRAAERQAQESIYAHLGLEGWEDFLLRYRSLRRAFHDQAGYSRAEMWAWLYGQYGAAAPLRRLRRWEERYWRRVEEAMAPFPEAGEVLEALASRYRLAVVTNSRRRGKGHPLAFAAFCGLERYFQAVVVGGTGDLPAKPAAEPFLLCLRRLGLSAAEAVYVGDDWQIDVCGARAAGLQPVWLKHYSVSRSWPREEDARVPVITTLRALLDLEGLLPAASPPPPCPVDPPLGLE